MLLIDSNSIHCDLVWIYSKSIHCYVVWIDLNSIHFDLVATLYISIDYILMLLQVREHRKEWRDLNQSSIQMPTNTYHLFCFEIQDFLEVLNKSENQWKMKNMDYIESVSALQLLTLKTSGFRAVLASGRHFCKMEEKQNALGRIWTSYLLIILLMQWPLH